MVSWLGIAAHIAGLRAVVGRELLLLPAVSVLPMDEAGRVLLVRHSGDDDGWGILGGAIDIGESPAAAAVREAREEISVDILFSCAARHGEAQIDTTLLGTDSSRVSAEIRRLSHYLECGIPVIRVNSRVFSATNS